MEMEIRIDEYNKEKGMSTVNLCHCTKHYIENSLDLDNCRNFQDFRKITLTKYRTQVEKKVKRKKEIIEKKQAEYEKAKLQLKRSVKELREAEVDFNHSNTLSEKLRLGQGI